MVGIAKFRFESPIPIEATMSTFEQMAGNTKRKASSLNCKIVSRLNFTAKGKLMTCGENYTIAKPSSTTSRECCTNYIPQLSQMSFASAYILMCVRIKLSIRAV